MIDSLKNPIENEHGFVMGTAILVSAILVLAGAFAIWTANTEMHIVRNEGQLIREFYDAEAGVVDGIENYTAWLTNEFMLEELDATSTITYIDEDSGDPVATIEVRPIMDEVKDTSLTNPADNLPLQPHKGPPPVNSGYSLKYFEIRRYGITTTSTNGNTQLQVGVYKVFNKY
ncbi:MAG: hypothetical protein JSV83_20140 [Desulfobacterales bacterium]|nr:MAG: hypothetical protein JSV83_20140 [Desulfobacterales bacterium]